MPSIRSLLFLLVSFQWTNQIAQSFLSELRLVTNPTKTSIDTQTRLCMAQSEKDSSSLDKGFNLLETASKFVPQGTIVFAAKESWKFAWKRMMAELAPQDKTGSYKRPSYGFTGRLGSEEFPDVAGGRYFLFFGNPCPWCHRAKLAIKLRNISPQEVRVIELLDDPVKASRGGWIISGSSQRSLPQTFRKARDLREIYDICLPNYQGRCTAPLLVDAVNKKIVSNESSDIVRMLGEVTFGNTDKERLDLYPPDLHEEVTKTNEWVYNLLNNGVYRCGFSTTQSAYDAASADVREGLQLCESILSKQQFICGSKFTEADLRLLPTILRFDGVYAPLFKAGGTHLRIRDYPNTHSWLKRCWNLKGVKESIDLADANASYYRQLFPLNAGGIIPTSVTAKEIGL